MGLLKFVKKRRRLKILQVSMNQNSETQMTYMKPNLLQKKIHIRNKPITTPINHKRNQTTIIKLQTPRRTPPQNPIPVRGMLMTARGLLKEAGNAVIMLIGQLQTTL